MIERLSGKVEKITFIKNIATNLDLCEIQIDFDTLKIFYDANELIQFNGLDVLYTVRPDVIEGKVEQVVCELVNLSTIRTVTSTENIKLIPEGATKRTVCNFAVDDVRFGGYYANVVAFMSGFTFGSSRKSKWFDCTMIDANSKEFSVRLFVKHIPTEQMEDLLNAYIGRYVNFDVNSTKYGLQTEEIVDLPNKVEQSPEVVVAMEVIRKVIASDPALTEYDSKYDFVNYMSTLIDGEPGYSLVRMASEIYMINAIDNISTDLDITSMKRAAICSHGYKLPSKTAWSIPLINVNKAQRIEQLKNDKELMIILDAMSREDVTPTKQTYIKIKGLVNDIIKIRRSANNEKIISNYADVVSMFNGLL